MFACSICICGGGPLEKRLRIKAYKLGLDRIIKFSGWCDDLSVYYKAFDVLLFNSDFDALGRTPGEAMGYGVVPVASVIYGGLSELVKHKINGFLLCEHDVDKLADYILRLASSDTLREDYSEAGRQILQQLFSLDAATGFYREWFGSYAV
jgi:glycosyltransferase involved in cell wall biosynthesis